LRLNELSYEVQPTNLFTSNKPARDILSDVSNSVTKLYHDLRLNQYLTYRERELENQLTFLRDTVRPLNEIHHQLANKAIRRLKWLISFCFCFSCENNSSFILGFNGQFSLVCRFKLVFYFD